MQKKVYKFLDAIVLKVLNKIRSFNGRQVRLPNYRSEYRNVINLKISVYLLYMLL